MLSKDREALCQTISREFNRQFFRPLQRTDRSFQGIFRTCSGKSAPARPLLTYRKIKDTDGAGSRSLLVASGIVIEYAGWLLGPPQRRHQKRATNGTDPRKIKCRPDSGKDPTYGRSACDPECWARYDWTWLPDRKIHQRGRQDRHRTQKRSYPACYSVPYHCRGFRCRHERIVPDRGDAVAPMARQSGATTCRRAAIALLANRNSFSYGEAGRSDKKAPAKSRNVVFLGGARSFRPPDR
jgi:hypothetical protein